MVPRGWRKHGHVQCRIDGCFDLARSLGMCMRHYKRHRKGTPESNPYGCTRYGKLWKSIKYVTAHKRCFDQWGKASQYPCVSCGGAAKEWSYDGTDPTEIYGPCGTRTSRKIHYSRFPEFYKPMCIKCHRQEDKNTAAQELEEYREWKYRTGLSLKNLDLLIMSGGSAS